MKWCIIFYCILLYPGMYLLGQNLTVHILAEGVRDQNSKLIVAVFASQSDFEKEKTCYEKAFLKTGLKKGRLKLEIELQPGIYGITILDDHDGDKKMKYNYFGIPREGFGIVNLETTGFRKPKFSDFSFELSKKEDWRKVKMRYIF